LEPGAATTKPPPSYGSDPHTSSIKRYCFSHLLVSFKECHFTFLVLEYKAKNKPFALWRDLKISWDYNCHAYSPWKMAEQNTPFMWSAWTLSIPHAE
jgi:hypothetical protein